MATQSIGSMRTGMKSHRSWTDGMAIQSCVTLFIVTSMYVSATVFVVLLLSCLTMSLVLYFFGLVHLFLFRIYHSLASTRHFIPLVSWISILLFKHHALLWICFVCVKNVATQHQWQLWAHVHESLTNPLQYTITVVQQLYSCTYRVQGTTGWMASIVAQCYRLKYQWQSQDWPSKT